MGVDRHHLLFPRKLHDAHPDTKELRRNSLLIPRLERIGHVALHSEVVMVPPLDRYIAGRVLKDYIPIRDDYERSAIEFMRSVDRSIKHENTSDISKMNAEVVIHSIERQLPFIREYQRWDE